MLVLVQVPHTPYLRRAAVGHCNRSKLLLFCSVLDLKSNHIGSSSDNCLKRDLPRPSRRSRGAIFILHRSGHLLLYSRRAVVAKAQTLRSFASAYTPVGYTCTCRESSQHPGVVAVHVSILLRFVAALRLFVIPLFTYLQPLLTREGSQAYV